MHGIAAIDRRIAALHKNSPVSQLPKAIVRPSARRLSRLDAKGSFRLCHETKVTMTSGDAQGSLNYNAAKSAPPVVDLSNGVLLDAKLLVELAYLCKLFQRCLLAIIDSTLGAAAQHLLIS